MERKMIPDAVTELDSAEYVLDMVGGILAMIEEAGNFQNNLTEDIAWSAMAVNYLLDDVKESNQKSRQAAQARRAAS